LCDVSSAGFSKLLKRSEWSIAHVPALVIFKSEEGHEGVSMTMFSDATSAATIIRFVTSVSLSPKTVRTLSNPPPAYPMVSVTPLSPPSSEKPPQGKQGVEGVDGRNEKPTSPLPLGVGGEPIASVAAAMKWLTEAPISIGILTADWCQDLNLCQRRRDAILSTIAQLPHVSIRQVDYSKKAMKAWISERVGKQSQLSVPSVVVFCRSESVASRRGFVAPKEAEISVTVLSRKVAAWCSPSSGAIHDEEEDQDGSLDVTVVEEDVPTVSYLSVVSPSSTQDAADTLALIISSEKDCNQSPSCRERTRLIRQLRARHPDRKTRVVRVDLSLEQAQVIDGDDRSLLDVRNGGAARFVFFPLSLPPVRYGGDPSDPQELRAFVVEEERKARDNRRRV